MSFAGGLHGALIIDKPEGPTSFAAMRQASRALGVRKSGHTGTLDPAASGVIVVLLGEATKLAGVLVHDDKVYEARIALGAETDTLDREGAVIATAPVPAAALDPDRIRAALSTMVGERDQVPPIYSALKKDGRTLMSRARAGEEVVAAPRRVLCHDLELLAVEAGQPPVLTVRVHSGKGYYVRSFARDLGLALGTRAHLVGLRRTRVGGFGLDRAVAPMDATPDRVVPIADLLVGWGALGLEGPRVVDIRHGRVVPVDMAAVTRDPADPADPRALACAPGGTPIALVRRDGDVWRVERGFMIDIPEQHD